MFYLVISLWVATPTGLEYQNQITRVGLTETECSAEREAIKKHLPDFYATTVITCETGE